MNVLMLDRMSRSITDGLTVLLMSVTPVEQRLSNTTLQTYSNKVPALCVVQLYSFTSYIPTPLSVSSLFHPIPTPTQAQRTKRKRLRDSKERLRGRLRCSQFRVVQER